MKQESPRCQNGKGNAAASVSRGAVVDTIKAGGISIGPTLDSTKQVELLMLSVCVRRENEQIHQLVQYCSVAYPGT